MFTHSQGSRITLDCQVECRENHELPENDDTLSGTFQFHIGTSLDAHELDQIEAEIEKIDQEFKRQLTQYVMSLRPATVVLPKLPGLPTRSFTSMACGLSPSSHGTAM